MGTVGLVGVASVVDEKAENKIDVDQALRDKVSHDLLHKWRHNYYFTDMRLSLCLHAGPLTNTVDKAPYILAPMGFVNVPVVAHFVYQTYLGRQIAAEYLSNTLNQIVATWMQRDVTWLNDLRYLDKEQVATQVVTVSTLAPISKEQFAILSGARDAHTLRYHRWKPDRPEMDSWVYKGPFGNHRKRRTEVNM